MLELLEFEAALGQTKNRKTQGLDVYILTASQFKFFHYLRKD